MEYVALGHDRPPSRVWAPPTIPNQSAPKGPPHSCDDKTSFVFSRGAAAAPPVTTAGPERREGGPHPAAIQPRLAPGRPAGRRTGGLAGHSPQLQRRHGAAPCLPVVENKRRVCCPGCAGPGLSRPNRISHETLPLVSRRGLRERGGSRPGGSGGCVRACARAWRAGSESLRADMGCRLGCDCL
jgi:hypothetical protein